MATYYVFHIGPQTAMETVHITVRGFSCLYVIAMYFRYSPLISGQRDRALEMQEDILKIRIRLLGRDHPETLQTMNNLAITYNDDNQWDKAVKLQKEVLEARIKSRGEGHPDTLLAMNNLAMSYKNQGQLEKAVELQVRALDVMARLLGKEHPNNEQPRNGISRSRTMAEGSGIGRESVGEKEKSARGIPSRHIDCDSEPSKRLSSLRQNWRFGGSA